MQRRASIAALGCLLACVAAPPTASPDRATAWGYVRLVPKAGLPAEEGGYSDRRLLGVQRFDYSHPAFAVVYAPGAPVRTAQTHELMLEARANGAHWSATVAAVGVNDRLRVANRTAIAQVVSAPALTWLRELAPGEATELAPAAPGELLLHVLGGAGETAIVWVSPGAFALANTAGRYELDGLPPEVRELRAWHPRLPPSAGHTVRLEAGAATRVDLEIGVDRAAGAEP
ncbi:MAG TPA: hypothetical protein VFT98_13520 [Myxococcota bacterium]|nr:hypothetical protein [Myxococcota bacterium]